MLQHPSFYLQEQQTETIRQYAQAAEAAGRLTPEQLGIAYSNNWFNLFVPVRFGGMGLFLPDALKLEEAIAWIDGSMGWTVTLCGGANWFIGFLPAETREKVFSNKQVCLAGSGKATGVATIVADGYEVYGTWKFATGSPIATAFTANCYIERDGRIEMDTAGNPVIKSFVFLPQEVQVLKSWHAIGMVATASHGFSIHALWVPESRCFSINSARPELTEPVFQYPFQQFAETTLTANLSGMAIRFLELGAALIDQDSHAIELHGLHLARFRQQREAFFQAVEESWFHSLESQHSRLTQTQEAFMAVSKAAGLLFEKTMEAVDSCYLLFGLGAADPLTEINRVWRNIHTASQHQLFRFANTSPSA